MQYVKATLEHSGVAFVYFVERKTSLGERFIEWQKSSRNRARTHYSCWQ